MGNTRNLAFWVVLFLLIVALFNVFNTNSSPSASNEVLYSDLVANVEAGNVSKVWVVDSDSTVHSREVVVGRVTPGGVQIVEGLAAGELVATAGVHTLFEGQQVLVAATEG